MILAGVKGRNLASNPANMTKLTSHLIPHSPFPQGPGSWHAAAQLFLSGHHSCRTDFSRRLAGHSHQLFSEGRFRYIVHPFKGFLFHLAWGQQSAPGNWYTLPDRWPGCGLKDQEALLYNPALKLALQLQGPAGEKVWGPLWGWNGKPSLFLCSRLPYSALFWDLLLGIQFPSSCP